MVAGRGGSRDAPKNVSTACDRCRKKKCKCNGKMPCVACLTSQSECIYNFHDGRRQRQQKLFQPGLCLLQQTPQFLGTTLPVDNSRGKNDVGIPIDVPGSAKDHTLLEETEEERHKITLEAEQSSISASQQGPSKIPNQRRAVLASAPSHQRMLTTRHDAEPPPNTYCLPDMQNKFRVTTISRIRHRETDPQDKSHSDSHSRNLLPLQESDAMISKPDRRLARGKRQEPEQVVWRAERKTYPAPGYTRSFGNLPFSSSVKANGYPDDVQARQMLSFSAPEYLVLPLNKSDESPLARALTDFQLLGRQLLADSASASRIAEEGPTDVTLFFRDRLPNDPMNASTWAAEMLKAFRGTFSDELLLACAVCVRNLLRWQLLPTMEYYKNVPAIIRPTQLQRMRPHAAWIDLMMFPAFRDALANRPREWVEPCMKANWELLWPHSLEQALVRSPCSDRVFLTPQFSAFVDDPKHWLMQGSILETFPEIYASDINIAHG